MAKSHRLRIFLAGLVCLANTRMCLCQGGWYGKSRVVFLNAYYLGSRLIGSVRITCSRGGGEGAAVPGGGGRGAGCGGAGGELAAVPDLSPVASAVSLQTSW